MEDHTQGWNKRNVRYEEIHNVSPDDLAVIARSLDLKEGHVFVDLMSGYGAVTKAVLDHCKSENININALLIDFAKEQIDRSKVELPDFSVIRLYEDVRSLSLADESVDRIAIKMGVHEVPRKDQYKVIAQAYRALKPGGILVIWDLMFKGHIEQLVFQTIVHEKNRLAGFYDMALNRYLPREEELRNYLENAGFYNIELVQEIPYPFSSEKRLHTELGGNESKLEEWDEFIRAVVPEQVKESINFTDKGRDIQATFRKGILRAVKPDLKGGQK